MSDVKRNYHTIPEGAYGTYVVISECGYWGADTELAEALINAELREHRRVDHFGNIDSGASLKQAAAEWKEWAREEWEGWTDLDPVEITIYWLTSEIWDGWRVNPIDGGLTAYPKGEHETEVLNALFNDAEIKATWHCGVLTPR